MSVATMPVVLRIGLKLVVSLIQSSAIINIAINDAETSPVEHLFYVCETCESCAGITEVMM